MNNQNNPQEVPQVKSVEEHFKYNDPHVYNLLAEEGLLSPVLAMLNKQQSRIAELEKQYAELILILGTIKHISSNTSMSPNQRVYKIEDIAEQALNSKENEI